MRCTATRVALSAVLVAACAEPTNPAEIRVSRPAMGTLVEIAVRHPEPARARDAIDAAFDEVGRLESLLSEWTETSEVSRLNRLAGGPSIGLSPETEQVLRLALEIAEATGGAFDPTVLPLVRLYGFLGGGEDIPTEAEIEAARRLIDWHAIELKRGRGRLAHAGVEIGLGGIAKGYIVDRALAVLRTHSVDAAIVNAGGDIAVFVETGPGFSIEIEVPGRPGEILVELDLRAGGLATSATTYRSRRQNGRLLHHIIDPRTGRPAAGNLSATAIAATTARADALATAFLVLGAETPDLVERLAGVESILVLADGERWGSSGLRGRLTWSARGRALGLVDRQHDPEDRGRVDSEKSPELEPREAGGDVTPEPG